MKNRDYPKEIVVCIKSNKILAMLENEKRPLSLKNFLSRSRYKAMPHDGKFVAEKVAGKKLPQIAGQQR